MDKYNQAATLMHTQQDYTLVELMSDEEDFSTVEKVQGQIDLKYYARKVQIIAGPDDKEVEVRRKEFSEV